MSPFEAIMLLCFGISWPISIAKSLRVKHVQGKSPVFSAVIAIGYMSGIIHKVFYNFDWILFLYALNLVMVTTDLVLYFHYSRYPGGKARDSVVSEAWLRSAAA